jgi:outer membrane protein assembly factor BamD (BamD/ComL family)
MNRAQLRNLLSTTTARKRSVLLYSSIIMLAATITALACGWSYVTDHSVRFNSFRTGRGFYRLPPLPIMFDSKTGKEIAVIDEQSLYMYNQELNEGPDSSAPPELTATDIWQNAQSAVQTENLTEAEKLFRKFIEITNLPTIGEEEQQWRRNSAYDRLDALSALRQGSKIDSVKSYLEARSTYDKGPTQNSEALVSHTPTDRNLQDNWDYLQAALLHSKQLKQETLEAFRKHAAKYPQSEKNEAVLYMIAKLQMESSYSFENENCGIYGKNQRGEAIENAKIEPTEKCRDEQWQKALKSFESLIKEYPNGRYVNDARGWLAFLYKRGGERAKALAEYYRLLGHPTDWNVRLQAKKSLQIIGHEYDDATLDELEKLIADDANTALAYAYHRIYNHAIDFTYEEVCDWCDDDWERKQEEEKRVVDARKAGSHELSRVAKFAAAMFKRYPHARYSGAFVVRVAQAEMELQNYPEALKLVRKALAMGLAGEIRAESLWIRGSLEHRQSNLKAARATFSQLIAEFPKGRLTEGARRLLALTAEDEDDLETALEQYLALDYEYDVAYFVDVLLPTDRLAKFVTKRENIPRHNQLLYALGVRYMRDRRWNEARSVLLRVQTKHAQPEYRAYNEPETKSFAKDPDWDWNGSHHIKTSWVMQDLKTIEILEYLEKAVDTAQGDEAKAEAMYQLASYQFEGDDLLFYNPAVWKGQRYHLLDDFVNSDRVRYSNETQTIFDHSQSHEGLSRAIPIYLEVVNKFPNTRAAKDALFSAAVAHERVSNLNPYWRDIYTKGLFAGPKDVDLSDVRSLYPNYKMPRAEKGWEPSTRTVNGGPGWEPKPKPLPKPTRTQNFERKFKRYFGMVEGWITPKFWAVTEGYTSYVREWLDALLTAVGTLLAGYLVLVGFHFRKSLSAAVIRLIYPEAPQELLPDSESRIEKVIGD